MHAKKCPQSICEFVMRPFAWKWQTFAPTVFLNLQETQMCTVRRTKIRRGGRWPCESWGGVVMGRGRWEGRMARAQKNDSAAEGWTASRLAKRERPIGQSQACCSPRPLQLPLQPASTAPTRHLPFATQSHTLSRLYLPQISRINDHSSNPPRVRLPHRRDGIGSRSLSSAF